MRCAATGELRGLSLLIISLLRDRDVEQMEEDVCMAADSAQKGTYGGWLLFITLDMERID